MLAVYITDSKETFFLEELYSSSASREIPACCETRRPINLLTKVFHLSLSLANITNPKHLTIILYILILLSSLG